MNRAPKIKIPKVDLMTFAAESLNIDPFWDDLIANGDKSYKSLHKRAKSV